MNYYNLRSRLLGLLLMTSCALTTYAQDVNVDVNLNIKHSVNGVSEFEREKYMTLHGTSFETDWDGEEDKLDYLLNTLDTYFGRDTGSATWKFNATEEDPNRPNRPSLEHMDELGTWLKGEYSKDYLSHQYEARSRDMIGGTNPHPTYPTLSWNGDGETWTGWQPMDVDVSAEWVVNYLDGFFRKSDGAPGEPLPHYWEVINEPDMPMMTGHMTCTSQEKIWEYHNLVALGVRERFGANNPNRPKIGGMTWGLHDFHLPDGISRYDEDYLDQWLDGDGYITYHNMMDSEANNYRTNPWYQWDIMWQGFMDTCGDNMDFYSIHIYDWPGWNLNANDAPAATRSGGHTEAMLDIIEWYDLYKNGERKELIVSEFGAVNGLYNENNRPGVYDQQRMDWENIKPFNAMFMQFLERPDYITKSMPFTPIKAIWGDIPDQDLRYPYAMMRDENGDGEWEWSEYIKFFQLWSNVKGTRIDTKSSNRDLQVDAYVEGNKTYLIINNLEDDTKTVDLSFYDDYENPVESVLIKNLYLDMNQGTYGKPALDEFTVNSAPGSVQLSNNATMILEYTFANAVTVDQSSEETKFMGEKIGSGYHEFGSELIHATSQNLSTSVNNVVVPNGEYEATLRISGAFFKAHLSSVEVKLNGVVLEHNSNWRGSLEDLRNQWLGVLEVDIPPGVLQASNTIECKTNAPTDWATTQIQVWDFSKAPGRSGENGVALTGLSIEGTQELMAGKEVGLTANLEPANATNKQLVWSSSAPSIITVDEFGVIKAMTNSGNATITAANIDGTIVATHTVAAIPYADTPVNNITIDEGATTNVQFYVTSPLTLTISPEDATNQEVVWSSSNDEIVSVDPKTGRVTGKAIGESAIVTATINDNGNIITASTTVTVGIVGEEKVYCDAMITEVTGNTDYTFDVFVNLLGEREVKVELLQGNTVLGTGSTAATVAGKDVVSVDVSLNTVPTIGNYTLRVTALSNGNQVIDQCSSNLSILDRIRPESIALTDWLREVEIGETVPVTANVLPENAYNKSINWTSSNSSVATVNNEGIVTGVSLGTTTIRATTQDGGLVAQTTIEVKSQVVVQPTVIIIPSDVTVFPNGSLSVSPVFEPEWTTEKSITWASSNTALATVDGNGNISAGGTTGTLTLTATSTSNPSVQGVSNVTVGTTLIIQAESFSGMGGPVGEIAIYDIPTGGQGINNVQSGDYVEFDVFIPQGGEYSVSFLAGTAVEDGVIEMFVDGNSVGSKQVPMNDWDAFANVPLGQNVNLSQGQVKIGLVGSGTSQWQWNLDKFELSFQGEITCDPLTGVTISSTETSIPLGQSTTFSASLIPQSACTTNISWTSSNTNIATVNQSGTVTGVGTGTATITATTQNGGFTATKDIIVENAPNVPVTGVSISPASLILNVGEDQLLTATVAPANATNKTVVWSSSNQSVATVDASGRVIAISEGSSVISATTVDGTFVASSDITVNEVTVTPPPSGTIVIEAEDFETTGGTFNDGNVPFGVNRVAGIGINWVNAGDWAEYTVNAVGTFEVEYMISTPMENATVQIQLDGNVVGNDNVVNNGQWDDYISLKSVHQLTLNGEHQLRVAGVGSNDWQFNLDKVILTPIETTVIPVTGVSLNATSISLIEGETHQLVASIAPSNASEQSVSWSTSNTNAVAVNNGTVTAIAEGSAVVTVTTTDGSYTATANVSVSKPSTGPASLVIEAEDFTSTGGTYNDGFVPLGVNQVAGLGINWVNTGDWSEYTIDVPSAGNYDIEYMISTPMSGDVAIQVLVDGSVVTTDAVPNNGQWDDYQSLVASSQAALTTGAHTVRIVASGSDAWQWNLDKVTFSTGSSARTLSEEQLTASTLDIYPNPANQVVNVKGLPNGSYQIALYNMNGQIVHHSAIDYRYVHQLDVSTLTTGVYLLRIVGEGIDRKVRIAVSK